MLKKSQRFVIKNAKYFMIICIITTIKSVSDFFIDEGAIERIIMNVVLSLYFWGLAYNKFNLADKYKE